MKKMFTVMALGSVAIVSADQYSQSYQNDSAYYPSYDNNGYYQNQPTDGTYYQQDQYPSSQGYYQVNGQNHQRNNQYYYQQAPRNQSYDQNQQYYQQQQYNQQYNQNQQRSYQNDYSAQNDTNQKSVSDQEIRKKIQDKLGSGWFSKGFQHVTFDVNNGYVTLRGSVDTLEDKNKVEDTVKRIDGVRQVSNQVNVVKEKQSSDSYSKSSDTYSKSSSSDMYTESQLQDSERKHAQDSAATPQDRQLNARIRDKLSGWFSKDYETIVIRTANGIVVISGSVEKPEDAQKISDKIKDVDGVRSVNNQVRVIKR